MSRKAIIKKNAKVYIGNAFDEWNAVKQREGFKSNVDFAQHLLAFHQTCTGVGLYNSALELSTSTITATEIGSPCVRSVSTPG